LQRRGHQFPQQQQQQQQQQRGGGRGGGRGRGRGGGSHRRDHKLSSSSTYYDYGGYEEEEEIFTVLKEWSQDDAGESVLFKDGRERYPDFELYRMIARTVHNHTPIAQLSRPIFANFECGPCVCMNIDSFLPM
jgi:hypothetical protein